MEHRQPNRQHKWLDWRSVKFQNAASAGYLGQGYSNSGQTTQQGGQNVTAVSNANTSQSSSGTGQTNQQNTYLPWQQQLQSQVAGAEGNLLAGNVPTSFTNPQAATQAYMNNFNQYVAPELASQYGAGSPAIGASLNSGLTNLAATEYQQGLQNYSNVLGGAQSAALTPTGQSGTQAQQQQGTSQTTQEENMTDLINMIESTSAHGISLPT
jgi:hypothetical protein